METRSINRCVHLAALVACISATSACLPLRRDAQMIDDRSTNPLRSTEVSYSASAPLQDIEAAFQVLDPSAEPIKWDTLAQCLTHLKSTGTSLYACNGLTRINEGYWTSNPDTGLQYAKVRVKLFSETKGVDVSTLIVEGESCIRSTLRSSENAMICEPAGSEITIHRRYDNPQSGDTTQCFSNCIGSDI